MLTDINWPSPQRLAVKVKTAAEKMIRQEHPWLFESSITKQNPVEGRAGDLAIVFDHKKNKFLALGLYDPDSPMRIKLLQFKKPSQLNEQWFEQKIKSAYDLRTPLLQTQTTGYRLIHGENDGLPDLITDVYQDVLVVKLYSAIWLPYLKEILPLLIKYSQCHTIVLRLSRSLQSKPDYLNGLYDGQIIYGSLPQEEIQFLEHGLQFSANVVHGHKTGYFLDHRHNRKKVGLLANGKTVLDVFSYAGGFTVHAFKGGATKVISLDISNQALAIAQKNVRLNFTDAQHEILAVDAFEGLAQLAAQGKQFDIVVIDPPSFAKRDAERERALQSYAKLTQLGVQLVKKNGLLVMASCSSRIKAEDFFPVVIQTLKESGRPFKELERTFHDIDHPIGFKEGEYLKCGYYRL